ncbi:MAG: histidine kinase [Spirochaetae bacterium HGW-Spirochaetae-4]|nr:MAG: histidine kinase [Spirochaetae bacterium HGW-Spirochaetae-4]HCG64501.1 histidine kinase [Sphaerochaeta sp.]HCS37024.1 histidine kinase [Sphaerochaeta sp.]
MQTIPINTYNSPTVILELIYRLKVKDVMTRSLVSVPLGTTMRAVQHLMREKSITGVPVVSDRRLLGIVSMDDIIQALDFGYINEPVELHMTKNLIVLEDDMPVSFAISYFDRYRYHRFPVLSKDKALVGMVTTRDISTRLLWEINHEVENLERMNQSTKVTDGLSRDIQSFAILKHDFENAGFASTEVKKKLKQSNVFPRTIRRAAIASYELEMNIVVHSNGGRITAEYGPHEVVITSEDSGPGIPDIDKAMEEGFSTANEWIRSLGFGAGMGLPNVRSVSDDFSITSSPSGTTVVSTIRFSDNEMKPKTTKDPTKENETNDER